MPNPEPVHTVVFDLDDTLYAEADFVDSGFRAVDHWLSVHEGVKGFLEHARRHFNTGMRGKIFDAALNDLGVVAVPERVTILVEVYRSHVPEISLDAAVSRFLDWTAPRFNLAVLTDGYAVAQRQKLEALKLRRWFDCIIVTDEIGRQFWKPHRIGFERIMARFAGAVAGYVYVADNPQKDFIAPRQLGWRTVRLRRERGEYTRHESKKNELIDLEITSLPELKTWLTGFQKSVP
ncbi:MAG: HAD family hydrolase [Opitutaceae bacterium]|nr:HAD family hydrolase [Opitutaceae bacterium]